MKKPTKLSKQRQEDRARASAMMSMDIITGAQNLGSLSPQEIFDREQPKDLPGSFKLARHWHQTNWFVEQVNLIKAAFYNYGLKLEPAREGKTAKKDAEKLKQWLEDGDGENADALFRYVGSVWDEWLLQDTVLSFWREENKVTPYLLLPETVKYSDAMGIEKLRVSMGYKKDQLTGAGLSEKDLRRYTQGFIELSENEDEYFKVLTRGLRGSGLSMPRLFRVFRTLSQNESMETGESMLAYAGRLVIRFHQLGFEVKSGSNAAQQQRYLWKKDRADGIEKFFKGRMGFVEATGQFDHNIKYIWVDPKLYDNRKWATIVDRMLWWAGPVGFMVMAKSPSPYLLPMLKAQAEADRDKVGRHLQWVVNRGFGIPVKVKFSWSNRIFTEPRLAWDMLKSLMVQGPVSLTTALEEADFDPAKEGERKREEAKAENDEALLPKFDPNHGNRPGVLADGQPGRKAGDKNNTGAPPSGGATKA